MAITINKLRSKEQTGAEMRRLINRYSSDLDGIAIRFRGRMVPVSNMSLPEMFDFVRKVPYRRDIKPIEVVARPGKILANRLSGMDCKKKAILLSSYLQNRGIPWRLIASSRLPSGKIHHVFPQIGFAGRWLNFDATYPHYRAFAPKTLTRAVVL